MSTWHNERTLTRALGIVLLCLTFATASFAASLSGTALHAQLMPVAGSSGGGTFDAQVSNTSTVNWQLTLRNVGRRATSAALRIGGAGGPSFVLCKPCGLRVHNTFVLTRAMAGTLVDKGGEVVVATAAHPRGALRGSVRRV